MTQRVHAEMDEEFVVFLIGMRINTLWKVWRWLPVFVAMPRMLRELDEDAGLLGTRTLAGWREFMVVQYWDSFEDLREYAHDPEAEHHPSWMQYNSRSDGTVGIWHETYLVEDGEYETVYNNLPPHGLGEAAAVTDAGNLVDATGKSATAGGRLGRTDGDDAPIAPDGTEKSR